MRVCVRSSNVTQTTTGTSILVKVLPQNTAPHWSIHVRVLVLTSTQHKGILGQVSKGILCFGFCSQCLLPFIHLFSGAGAAASLPVDPSTSVQCPLGVDFCKLFSINQAIFSQFYFQQLRTGLLNTGEESAADLGENPGAK